MDLIADPRKKPRFGHHLFVFRALCMVFAFFAIIMAAVRLGALLPTPPQIAFQSNRANNWDIFVTDISRHLEARLTFARSFDYAPVWSPDGTRIAFVSSRTGFYDIYMLDIARHRLDQVTDDLSAETNPSWVNSYTLRYNVMGEVETGDYLYQLDLRSGDLQFLGSAAPYPREPVQSPDAQYVAATKIERGNLDIAIWNVQSTGEGRIAAHATNENYPAWSSDSQWLAFASDRDGNWEIYIASLDGNHVHRVTYNNAQDIMPSWRPGT
jgi:Tol biopolymer transport system component